MAFTQVQNGATTTGSTSSNLTTITLPLPVASTAGTLLVASFVLGAAGFPLKVSAVGPGGNPNTAPGWEWCATGVNGSGGGGEQVEIWCYRQNPGGVTNTTWTYANGGGARGHIAEYSTTSAWQVMELFPGMNTAVAGAATSFPVSMTNAVSSGELAVATFGGNYSPSTSVTWTTPSGWTLNRDTSGSTFALHWASYYKTTAAAGAVSVTGTVSTATNQVGWEGLVVVFREAASVRSRVGGSCSPGTYNDQASFGLPATKPGSAAEADIFVGRTMFQSCQVSYQQEGAHLTSGPSADITALSGMGAQICWALKPRRTGLSGFTSVAAEQAAMDQDISLVKQAGITGFICTLYNEYNLGGGNGPFGNDTSGADPYGNVGTGATAALAAQRNWLAYWANYAPVATAHGIPIMTKPSFASAPSCSSWHPAAGTVSGVMADFYYSDSSGKGVYLDASPGNDPGTGNVAPALTDVCDGVRNPDNSVPIGGNRPIPLGLGEWGRSGGGTFPAWSSVVSWSASRVRGVFTTRLGAGKQNAPVIWFENNINGPNWIHTPGFNGEDQTGIQAELAATVDALAPQASGTTVTVTTTSLPNAVLGSPYSQALQVTGGASPYTWALNSGSLPTGLSISSAGVISGTPSVAGTSTFTAKATDAGANVGISGSLQIIVPGISVTTTSLPAASIGVAYTQTLTESGGTGPFTWAVTTGTLPGGITLSSGGVLSGTTSASPGAYGFTVTVTDSLSNTSPAAVLALVVSAGATGGGTPALPAPGYPQLVAEAGFYASAPVATPGSLILDDPVFGTLDSATLSDATAWTDITTYVRSGTISRPSTRVQGPLVTYQAGTATAVFDNASGNFDPDNPAGAFVVGGVSGIRPMIPVRVRAIYGNVSSSLFSGFADSWTETAVDYDAGWSEVTAAATDGFKILAGVTLPPVQANGAGEPSGSRVNRILDAAGWYTDHRRTDAGNSEMQQTAYGDTALNLLQLTADSEIGELYVDGAGNVVFRERAGILNDTRSTTPQAVFGDLPGYNPLTADSQGFEVSTGTWTQAGNSTIAQTTAQAHTGTGSLAVTSAAAGSMVAASCLAASITTQGLPVAPGIRVPCSAWFRAAATPRQVQVGAQFYTAAGTAVGSILYGPQVTDATTGWVQATAVLTAPATAAYARLSVQIVATGGASEVHYVDDAALSLTELACAAIGRATDDAQLANDIQITAAGSANMQQVKNGPSIAANLFPRSYSRTDVLLTSDAEALTYAQWVLNISLAAEDRFDTLTIDPVADPANLFPQVLAREIGDMITVYRRPQNSSAVIAKPCFIRGISHSIDVTAGTWQTVWDLQDATKYAGFFILNDGLLGRLSSGNKLAY